MATSIYFNQNSIREKRLLDDLVGEVHKQYGYDCYYLPRKRVDVDAILGEDPSSEFDDAYTIELFVENPEGWGGEQDIISRFGLEVRDTQTFTMSRKSWEQFISMDANLVTSFRPQEGDIIYYPPAVEAFEIRFVNDENPFYPMASQPVFHLECETYQYSHEKIDVGIAELDNIEDKYSYQVSLQVAAGGSGTFVVGETVTQTVATGYTVSGQVTNWDAPTRTLHINNITFSDTRVPTQYNMFVLSSNVGAGNIVGGTSSASWTVSTAPNTLQLPTDGSADNQDFETAGDNIIDFSESNPFGAVT